MSPRHSSWHTRARSSATRIVRGLYIVWGETAPLEQSTFLPHLAGPIPSATTEAGPTMDTRVLSDATGRAEMAGTLDAGEVVGGRYRIDALLATCSMGTVYAAIDTVTGEGVAIKGLLPIWRDAAERDEAEAWFRREGAILLGLRHPAIPRIHAALEERGRYYLAMDLVQGETLEEALQSAGNPGLPEAQVLLWADQILDLLGYLHNRPDPLIFRDLKPANVMRTALDGIRLIDFGTARIFAHQVRGTAIGTPGYAPPEQYQGLAEPASDIYALGATIHHLLSGRDPRQQRPFDFPALRSIAPWISGPVASAVDRALALDPNARFSSTAECRTALHLPDLDAKVPGGHPAAAMRRATTTLGAPLALRHSDAWGAVLPARGKALGPRSIAMRPWQLRVLTLGGRSSPALETRTVRLTNRTDRWLYCAFSPTLPWIHPDRYVGWLEPRGTMDLGVRVGRSDAGMRKMRGGLEIYCDGRRWQLPVRQRVRGRAWPLVMLGQSAAGTLAMAAVLLLVQALGRPLGPLFFAALIGLLYLRIRRSRRF